ncbi:hypothetical protein [Alkalihalobacillus deserti]|uniref:hypothetical protein n=1 Tax=Alkalihalobacillus deserti TaxID=2879466 RepID=UPI001D14E87A|nr:hypothetical protein [Alkalihalobacillus deserti]
MNKYNVGQTVHVKDNLVIGQRYYNYGSDSSDIFTSRMEQYLGKKAVVVQVDPIDNKYKLNIDRIHSYTDEMLTDLTTVTRDVELGEIREEVDSIIQKSLSVFYTQQVEEALKNGLWKNNLTEFQELLRLKKKYE